MEYEAIRLLVSLGAVASLGVKTLISRDGRLISFADFINKLVKRFSFDAAIIVGVQRMRGE